MTEANSAARERFATLLNRQVIPLDEAALAIAAEEYPDLDPGPTLRALDALATRVGAEVGDLRPPLRVLQAMRTVLRAEGFHGNEKDYYDPRNSFLNEVLERRLGIPITLSVCAIEVGRRLEVPVRGIGLPGHFLVECEGRFADPFHLGRMYSREELEPAWRRLTGLTEPLDVRLLAPVSDRGIVLRMLNNLKNTFVAMDDPVPLRTLAALRSAFPELTHERAEYARWLRHWN